MTITEERDGEKVNGVASVDRALAIVSAFTSDDRTLTLADLSERTGLYKSTILRIAGSLIRGFLLERLTDGCYRLGPLAARLGDVYRQSVGGGPVILPIMQELADISGESVGFYVPVLDSRICIYRINSRQSVRYEVREGQTVSLSIGAGGPVIQAFLGKEGEPFDTIRRNFFYDSANATDVHSAGIAVPVFGPERRLVGALAVIGPTYRVDNMFLHRMRGPALDAAARASMLLGERVPELEELARRYQQGSLE